MTLKEIATKINGKVWEKGDMKRIYLNNVGHNTNKMRTKAFIWFDDSKRKCGLSITIECLNQPDSWCISQTNILKNDHSELAQECMNMYYTETLDVELNQPTQADVVEIGVKPVTETGTRVKRVVQWDEFYKALEAENGDIMTDEQLKSVQDQIGYEPIPIFHNPYYSKTKNQVVFTADLAPTQFIEQYHGVIPDKVMAFVNPEGQLIHYYYGERYETDFLLTLPEGTKVYECVPSSTRLCFMETYEMPF